MQISELRVRVGNASTTPDPANIQSAGDWYFLDHIASGLIAFDQEKASFVPNLADWKSSPDQRTHQFTIRPGARFSDGTPITATDVAASIKRLLIKKTSTHFPLWEYVEGCESLKAIDDECDGLRVDSANEISITLKTPSESFFLQVASPEAGVWFAGDIHPSSLEIRPTKFSGIYAVEDKSESGFRLRKNQFSLVGRNFPDSPESIALLNISLPEAKQRIISAEIDVLVTSYSPNSGENWENEVTSVHRSTPSTIIYLQRTSSRKRQLGSDFFKALWENNNDPEIVPASTFLPFQRNYSLTEQEFLRSLPESSSASIRIGVPWNFFVDDFLGQITKAASKAGATVDLIRLERGEWFAACSSKEESSKIDFVLVPYAASERYPAVQLRYITPGIARPTIDLKSAETPELTDSKRALLRDYQQWLLQEQLSLPLFFTRMQVVYAKDLNPGFQSVTDAEVELWRFTRK